MSTSAVPASGVDLEAVRILLARMNISAEDLLAGAAPRVVPTFDEYLDRISDAVPAGTRRAYLTHWRRIRHTWGQRRLDEPTASEIKQLAESTRTAAVVRSNSRGSRSAGEHMIAALRCIYRHAIADGLLPESANPAIRVPKPRRLASTRRALTDAQLALISLVSRVSRRRRLEPRRTTTTTAIAAEHRSPTRQGLEPPGDCDVMGTIRRHRPYAAAKRKAEAMEQLRRNSKRPA